MNAPALSHDGLTLEERVLERWFAGQDTCLIARSLKLQHRTITEAKVAKIVADEMDRRHAARTKGGARA